MPVPVSRQQSRFDGPPRWSSCSFLSFLHGGLECRECVAPEVVEVVAELAEAVGIDAVETSRSVSPFGDETGLLEHAEMLRHGGPAHRQLLGQLRHGQRTSAESFEHSPSGRIPECVKRIYVSHDLRKCILT